MNLIPVHQHFTNTIPSPEFLEAIQAPAWVEKMRAMGVTPENAAFWSRKNGLICGFMGGEACAISNEAAWLAACSYAMNKLINPMVWA